MLLEIFLFELKYRIKRPDTYLFFTVIFLFSIIAFNFIYEGQDLGLVKENAPYVIAKVMAVVSAIFMVITSMVMGVPILRDFEYNVQSLLFVNSIAKSDYLLGRFLGSFVILLFIFSGMVWGMMIGEFMSWRNPDNLLPFNIWSYLKPFFTIIFPTLFFGACIFFISGTLSRKLIVVYTQGLVFFMLSIMSFSIENKFIGGLLEPFSFSAIDQVVQHWEIASHNEWVIPITGILLYNRILWMLIGIIVFAVGYKKFNFNVVKEVSKKKNSIAFEKEPGALKKNIIIPAVQMSLGFKANWRILKAKSFFYFKSILNEAAFRAIIICAVGTIFINSINIGTIYGVNSYPTTYLIVEELKEMSLYFFLIILIFYSGEVIWKDKGNRMHLITDALPTSDLINLSGKFIGLMMTYALLLFILIIAGISFQVACGYYNFDLQVYFTGLYVEIFPFLALFTFLTFFFHILSNSKFIGHILVVIFFILLMLQGLLGWNHGLNHFGGIGLEKHSDMNGYGHFMKPYLWFKLYWFAFCFILFSVTAIFTVRGTETKFKTRWKLAKQRLTKPVLKFAGLALIVFITSGSYIFYNTNILNIYYSSGEQISFQVAYEKALKKLEYIPQPKITAVNLKVELYPKQQDYTVEGFYMLENKTPKSINEIHVQKRISDIEKLEVLKFNVGAVLNDSFAQYGYNIYKLDQPLQSGDSLRMDFRQTAITHGFTASNNETHIVDNGTFFTNDRFPSLGYNNKYELRNEKDRTSFGLSARENKADRLDENALVQGQSGDDGSKVLFEMTIGTHANQTAIAPGNLQKSWVENNRRYFHYKMNAPMVNFYSIVSAEYELLKDQWIPTNTIMPNAVDLEIYYHKQHDYNLSRMMKSMKMSLEYFTNNFGPYPYEQMRIMEYPRYQDFAQAFPTTVPYSEALGFVLDIDDEKDVDMPFFITAHELAHQWWGLQLVAANVKGKHFIIETLSQYSALMVLKQAYPAEKVQLFLEKELERYLKGRKNIPKPEVPLELVENQEYIYYSKGAINMFALQDYISEDSVNIALQRFIKEWNDFDESLENDHLPTSADLLHYFKAVTPDSLQYIISDLFQSITCYDNELKSGFYEKLANNKYKVHLSIAANKFQADTTGHENSIPFRDWVAIGIYAKNEEGKNELLYMEKHKLETTNTTVDIIVDQLPAYAEIDPKQLLIDKDRENNGIDIFKSPQ